MGTIIVTAGHDKAKDPGAIAYNGEHEADLVLEQRELVCRYLQLEHIKGFGSPMKDPDQLDLYNSIRWANDNCKEPAKSIGLDLHMNYNAPYASGTETFYALNTNSYNIQMAMQLANRVAAKMGIPSRGAKPDIKANCGRLGMLRDTTMPYLLLETGFLNERDLTIYHQRKEEVAKEIAAFLSEYYNYLNK